jgi:hypothetical protein
VLVYYFLAKDEENRMQRQHPETYTAPRGCCPTAVTRPLLPPRNAKVTAPFVAGPPAAMCCPGTEIFAFRGGRSSTT